MVRASGSARIRAGYSPRSSGRAARVKSQTYTAPKPRIQPTEDKTPLSKPNQIRAQLTLIKERIKLQERAGNTGSAKYGRDRERVVLLKEALRRAEAGRWNPSSKWEDRKFWLRMQDPDLGGSALERAAAKGKWANTQKGRDVRRQVVQETKQKYAKPTQGEEVYSVTTPEGKTYVSKNKAFLQRKGMEASIRLNQKQAAEWKRQGITTAGQLAEGGLTVNDQPFFQPKIEKKVVEKRSTPFLDSRIEIVSGTATPEKYLDWRSQTKESGVKYDNKFSLVKVPSQAQADLLGHKAPGGFVGGLTKTPNLSFSQKAFKYAGEKIDAANLKTSEFLKSRSPTGEGDPLLLQIGDVGKKLSSYSATMASQTPSSSAKLKKGGVRPFFLMEDPQLGKGYVQVNPRKTFFNTVGLAGGALTGFSEGFINKPLTRGVEFAAGALFTGGVGAMALKQKVAKGASKKALTAGLKTAQVAGVGLGGLYAGSVAKEYSEATSIKGKGLVLGEAGASIASFTGGSLTAKAGLTAFKTKKAYAAATKSLSVAETTGREISYPKQGSSFVKKTTKGVISFEGKKFTVNAYSGETASTIGKKGLLTSGQTAASRTGALLWENPLFRGKPQVLGEGAYKFTIRSPKGKVVSTGKGKTQLGSYDLGITDQGGKVEFYHRQALGTIKTGGKQTFTQSLETGALKTVYSEKDPFGGSFKVTRGRSGGFYKKKPFSKDSFLVAETKPFTEFSRVNVVEKPIYNLAKKPFGSGKGMFYNEGKLLEVSGGTPRKGFSTQFKTIEVSRSPSKPLKSVFEMSDFRGKPTTGKPSSRSIKNSLGRGELVQQQKTLGGGRVLQTSRSVKTQASKGFSEFVKQRTKTTLGRTLPLTTATRVGFKQNNALLNASLNKQGTFLGSRKATSPRMASLLKTSSNLKTKWGMGSKLSSSTRLGTTSLTTTNFKPPSTTGGGGGGFDFPIETPKTGFPGWMGVGGPLGRKRGKPKASNRKFAYAPDLASIELGIKGKVKTPKRGFTGLEIRPLRI